MRKFGGRSSKFAFAKMTAGAAICALAFTSQALALDSAEVLPAKVDSPAFRMGVISGVDQRYVTDGSLMTLTDYHSLEFDTRQLAKFEPRVQDLVDILNQFGRQELGSALHLGTLKVKTEPEVRYFAPLYARGITDNWTLAVGVPIVQYNNRISFEQYGSNLPAIRTSVGRVSTELDDAFDQLSVNFADGVQEALVSKGYKPLVDRRETIVGDVQLASLYRFHDSSNWTGLFKTIVSLPTGPGDDPDDLADLAAFGLASIEPVVLATARVSPRLTLAVKGSVRYALPDQVVKRVPESNEDTLPGPERKEKLKRQVGLATSAGVSSSYKLMRHFSAGVGYEQSYKDSDRYQGSRGWNYDSLSRDSETSAGRARFGFAYDSTESYFRKEALLPTIVSYEFSDTVNGSNIERQTVHELWVTLFF